MVNRPVVTRNELPARNAFKKKKEHRKSNPVLMTILILVVWGGLFYAGYWYMDKLNTDNRLYIDAKVEGEVNQLKEMSTDIYEKIVVINDQLVAINQEMSLTSDLLYGTDTNKVLLQTRIAELNAELDELQVTIKGLKDATAN